MAKDPPERRIPPVVAYLLWGVVRTAMWLSAVTGPLLILAGAASYFVDLSDFFPLSGLEAIRAGITLGTVGIAFVWLRTRSYIRFTGEVGGE